MQTRRFTAYALTIVLCAHENACAYHVFKLHIHMRARTHVELGTYLACVCTTTCSGNSAHRHLCTAVDVQCKWDFDVLLSLASTSASVSLPASLSSCKDKPTKIKIYRLGQGCGGHEKRDSTPCRASWRAQRLDSIQFALQWSLVLTAPHKAMGSFMSEFVGAKSEVMYRKLQKDTTRDEDVFQSLQA